MVGLNPGESSESQPGGRFVFFWLILFLTDMAMGSLFRFLANILPNMEVGQTVPGAPAKGPPGVLWARAARAFLWHGMRAAGGEMSESSALFFSSAAPQALSSPSR